MGAASSCEINDYVGNGGETTGNLGGTHGLTPEFQGNDPLMLDSAVGPIGSDSGQASAESGSPAKIRRRPYKGRAKLTGSTDALGVQLSADNKSSLRLYVAGL